MSFDWQPVGNSLLMRQDDWSWQGSVADDPMAYLRRAKEDERRITDANLSTLTHAEIAALLATFLRNSGGLQGTELIFSAIRSCLSSTEMEQTIREALEALGAKEVKVSMSVDVQDGELACEVNFSRAA